MSSDPAFLEFLKLWQSMDDAGRMALGRSFHEHTGGRLSAYNSPMPVCVGMVPVVDGDGLFAGVLGVVRKTGPHAGGLALPGGFLEPGEDVCDGVRREIFEETGIDVSAEHFLGYGAPKPGGGNSLLVFLLYRKSITMAQFQQARQRISQNDGEVSDLHLLDDTSTLCFPLHQNALNDFLAGARPALSAGTAKHRGKAPN